ncbi:hypothetical protein HPB48_020274 [Haemaphysalis longicornis]|uniref:HTH psq-type domain-containing protein n=1 Tax=Haemaphysalis longicornis TaxID=44386 RepID=A0A9J6FTT0_HAELO|nr:hypothetical protein HPB48_020274 [Haemaphysalis longicornis]
MAANVKKRTSLTFATKLKIIRRVEKGEQKSSVAAAYNIPRSTLSTCSRRKVTSRRKRDKASTAVHAVFGNQPSKTSKDRSTGGSWTPEPETFRCRGLCSNRKRRISHSSTKPRASSQAVDGLQRFKARYQIVGKTVSGESEDASDDSIKKWLDEEWPRVLAKYDPKEIFNADETGLFWQMLPRRTLDTRGEKCHGGQTEQSPHNSPLGRQHGRAARNCGPLSSASLRHRTACATAATFLSRTRGTGSRG